MPGCLIPFEEAGLAQLMFFPELRTPLFEVVWIVVIQFKVWTKDKVSMGYRP